MEEKLVKLLMEKKKTIATAESCTGGLISSAITNVGGSSSVFGFGFVTYANEAKMKLLGVLEETLKTKGAVSFETAEQMALGAKKVSGADIAVSVTGIAGPGGGTKEKPVGLVYIGLAFQNEVKSLKFHFEGDRESVREQTKNKAIEIVIESLQ